MVAENQQKVAEYMDACDKAVDEVENGVKVFENENFKLPKVFKKF